MPALIILTAPGVDAEVKIGRRTAIVPPRALVLFARNVRGAVESINEAEVREADPRNVHAMGYRTSSLSFGAGHLQVRAFGPRHSWSGGEPDHTAGMIELRVWTTRRGHPALDVLIDRVEAEALAAFLEAAADPPGRFRGEFALPVAELR